MFKRAGIAHNVLNAKYHQREAEIVANAGQPGAVTIATNMAGRGTDIKLGAGVTEAKPSTGQGPRRKGRRRRGMRRAAHHRLRAARIAAHRPPAARPLGTPGRPGRVAVLPVARRRPDAALRVGPHRELMDRMGAQEGEVLTHPLITRSIEQAQKRVELQNFQSRKRLLEYDDVMNQQREVIYSLRSFALEGGEELKGEAVKMVQEAVGAARRDGARRRRGPDGLGRRAAAPGPAHALPAHGPVLRGGRHAPGDASPRRASRRARRARRRSTRSSPRSASTPRSCCRS